MVVSSVISGLEWTIICAAVYTYIHYKQTNRVGDEVADNLVDPANINTQVGSLLLGGDLLLSIRRYAAALLDVPFN